MCTYKSCRPKNYLYTQIITLFIMVQHLFSPAKVFWKPHKCHNDLLNWRVLQSVFSVKFCPFRPIDYLSTNQPPPLNQSRPWLKLMYFILYVACFNINFSNIRMIWLIIENLTTLYSHSWLCILSLPLIRYSSCFFLSICTYMKCVHLIERSIIN